MNARVLKFHIQIPHEKIVDPYFFFMSKLCPFSELCMAYTCLIVLDPEMPFTLPEMKGISGTDGAHY